MARGANNGAAPGKRAADLEQFKQLVELQSQIVELDRRNAQVAQQCAALREKVSREAHTLLRSRSLARLPLRAATDFLRLWRPRSAWAVALKWLS